MDIGARPREVTRYVVCMRVLGVLYGVSAALFLFLPEAVIYLLNFVPKFLKILEVMPDSTELFWLPPAVSMLVMLVVLSFCAAAQPENRLLAWIQVLAKLSSTAGYLYLFLFRARYFAYLVGFTTDLCLFLLVLWITLSVRRTLGPSEEKSPAT